MDTGSTFQASLDEDARRRFEAGWRAGRPEPIEHFLPPEDHPHYLPTLEELIHIELELLWKARGGAANSQGDTLCLPLVEGYLERFAALNQPAILRRLLKQEYQSRRRHADPPAVEEYLERFPGVISGPDELVGTPVLGTAAVPTELPQLPGYQVLGILGRGGMGVVYKARQLGLNRLVAIKMVLGHTSLPEERVRFLIEAEAVARLQHPHIVQVHEVNRHEAGRPYLVMEFLEGGTLAERLRRGPPLQPRPAAELVETLARAVEHAHRRGIIHRDLKPANVLLTADGAPKVADFGLARHAEGGGDLTRTGEIVGTPSYMAPEQAAGNLREVGAAADVYGLGAILYELLTGKPPFRGTSVLETLERVRTVEPVPPSRLRAGVPRDLETIALCCLHKDPARRYPGAEELADDLRRFLEGRPIQARPSSAWERAYKWARRRPALAALLGVTAVAALCLLAGGLWYNARLQEALGESQGHAAEASAHAAEARARAEEKRGQLVRLHVDNGWRLVDEGDFWGSLLWFTEALRLDEGRPAEEAQRVRLAAVLRQRPVPAQVWFHDGTVNQVVFSPDGRRAATACVAGTAHVWDVRTGEAVGRPLHHPGPVYDVAFDATGRRLATACRDQQARVWDLATGQAVGPALEHAHIVWQAWFDGAKRLVTRAGSWDGTANRGETQVWDLAAGRPLATPFRFDPLADGADAVSRDGRRAFAGAGARAGRVWDTLSGEPVAPALKGAGKVRHAGFSADGRRLVTCGADQVVRLWEVDTGRPVGPPLPHPGGVTSAAFSPDGRRLVTISDRAAYVWAVPAGRPLTPALRHAGPVILAVFSGDGSRVATACEDGTARVWDAAGGRPLTPPLQHGRRVRTAVFSPDGRYLLTGSEDSTARLWDLAATASAPPPAAEADVTALGLQGMALAPDGRRVFAVRADGAAQVLDVDTGLPITPPLRHPVGYGFAAFSPDGRRVVVLGGAEAHVWDAVTGERVGPALRHGNWLPWAAFNSDGRLLLTASMDGAAHLWDVARGQKVCSPFRHSGGGMQGAAFSPDGQRVVTVGDDQMVRVWDAATGAPLTEPFKCGPVRYATFSPDGRRVLTGAGGRTSAAYAGTACVWDAATGKVALPQLAHADAVRYAAFSPDGGRIVTASDDGTARVWDAATGQALTSPLKHAGAVRHASFSPDGQWIVTASDDGTARVWEAATGQALTPPLPHPAAVLKARFRAGGREVVTVSRRGPARVWDLRRERRPVADLKRLAELLAGRRIDPTGSWLPLDGSALRSTWEALRAKYPADFAVSARRVHAWHWDEAEDCTQSGAWVAAVRHLNALLRTEPGNRAFLSRRAGAEAELGRWDSAADDYERLLARKTEDRMVPYLHALARLGAGDRPGYRKACAEWLKGLGSAPSPEAAALASWTSLLNADAVADLPAVVRLAERAAAASPQSSFYAHTHGAALYRAGRSEAALGPLTRAIQLQGRSPAVQTWLFMAMAHYRVGQKAEARRRLRQATDVLDTPASEPPRGGRAALAWAARLELDLLRREAEGLIDSPGP